MKQPKNEIKSNHHWNYQSLKLLAIETIKYYNYHSYRPLKFYNIQTSNYWKYQQSKLSNVKTNLVFKLKKILKLNEQQITLELKCYKIDVL